MQRRSDRPNTRLRFLAGALLIIIQCLENITAFADESHAKEQWQHLAFAGKTIQVFKIAPSNPNVLYAAVYKEAVYRSDDGGANWKRLAEFEGCVGAKSILIHPEKPSHVIVTSGG